MSSERRFVFHGIAGTYFRIAIVNACLSIITLGIYSAWAKVRTMRYFAGNVELDGHRFDYHAEPLRILKGRIIAVIAFVAYNALYEINQAFSLALTILFFVALPWIINASLRFNAFVSSYRNVRFSFGGSYFRSLHVFVIMPALGYMTLGLLTPVADRMSARYYAGEHRFGDQTFSCDPPLGAYYGALFKAAVVVVLVLVSAGGLALVFDLFNMMSLNLSDMANNREDSGAGSMSETGAVLFTAVPVLAFMAAFIALGAWRSNIFYNHLEMNGGHRFRSELRARRMLWIALTNLLAIALTIGLAIPWARIRKARYVASCMTFLPNGELDEVMGTIRVLQNAVGEEMGEVFGTDVGF
ncbi:MAG: YjgN family protein [Geminicoccaceae bacterium]